ncbi:hypothetical protein CYMTET_35350 [Cymbomonas tetramitiformis]|uniref:Uncharacterized protein n=1 Tax=Cymbomonas tetramitiformis TaxID=36881 RepID=A0AAE0KP15_9CHLO|nr:hypothetical protein CYMTET_35350 [Cymbomonas tetramitiformis]
MLNSTPEIRASVNDSHFRTRAKCKTLRSTNLLPQNARRTSPLQPLSQVARRGATVVTAAAKPIVAPTFNAFCDSLVGSWEGQACDLDFRTSSHEEFQEGVPSLTPQNCASRAEEVWRVCGGAISGVQFSALDSEHENSLCSAEGHSTLLRRDSATLVCFEDGAFSDGPEIFLPAGGEESALQQFEGQIVTGGDGSSTAVRAHVTVLLEDREVAEVKVRVEGRGRKAQFLHELKQSEATSKGMIGSTSVGAEGTLPPEEMHPYSWKVLRVKPGGPGGSRWEEMYRKWQSEDVSSRASEDTHPAISFMSAIFEVDEETSELSAIVQDVDVVGRHIKANVVHKADGTSACSIEWGNAGVVRIYGSNGSLQEVSYYTSR